MKEIATLKAKEEKKRLESEVTAFDIMMLSVYSIVC